MTRVATFFLMLVAIPTTLPAATESPVRVTTDSSAYCQELLVRVTSQPNPPAVEHPAP